MKTVKTIVAVALAGCLFLTAMTGCNLKFKWKANENSQTTTQAPTQAPTEAESTASLKNEDGKYVSMEAYYADPIENYKTRTALSGRGYTVEIIAEENTVIYEVKYVVAFTDEEKETLKNNSKNISQEKKNEMISGFDSLTAIVDVDPADIKVAYRFLDNEGNIICQTDYIQKEE